VPTVTKQALQKYR